MRRCLIFGLLAALLCVTAAPAIAQTGGAVAPDLNAPAPERAGGVAYDPNAPAPAKTPAKKRNKRRSAQRRAAARKLAARREAARAKRKRGRGRSGGAKPTPPPASVPPPTPAPVRKGHRFPLLGAYSFGGEDSRFGAGRPGHIHQGQDVSAAQGTPIVAPRTGTVEVVGYQASGAGLYVVLDGDGEDRDYVFMHLRTGSTVVTEGQRVRIGQKLGEVGNTGISSGPHLHFEVWTRGGWYTGGKPVDPLPMLRAWLRN